MFEERKRERDRVLNSHMYGTCVASACPEERESLKTDDKHSFLPCDVRVHKEAPHTYVQEVLKCTQ